MSGSNRCHSTAAFRGDIQYGSQAIIDIADLVYSVSYMFQGGLQPPCEAPLVSGYCAETDMDGNRAGPDISDLVYLVTYMFASGPVPVACQ